MTKLIFNNKAQSYVLACVFILVLCLILSTAVYFAISSMRIQAVKKHVKNTLDSICTIFSIDSYGSVKQDLYYPEPLKRVEITDKALEMLGFKDLDVITLHDGTIMHKPTISVSFDHGTHITAQFLYESHDGIYKAFLRVTGGFFRRDGN